MSYYPSTLPCSLLLSLLLIAKRRRGTIDRSFVRSSCFGRQLAGIPAKEPRPTKIIQHRWKGSPESTVESINLSVRHLCRLPRGTKRHNDNATSKNGHPLHCDAIISAGTRYPRWRFSFPGFYWSVKSYVHAVIYAWLKFNLIRAALLFLASSLNNPFITSMQTTSVKADRPRFVWNYKLHVYNVTRDLSILLNHSVLYFNGI